VSDLESQPQLGEAQHRVLELVLAFFHQHLRWPTYRWLNQLLYVEYKHDLDELFTSMPPGLLLPDASSRARVGTRPEGEVSLTLRGLACVGAEHDLDVVLRTLATLAQSAGEFIPDPDGPQDLTVTSADVAAVIGCEPDDPALVLAREIISNSVWEIWSGLGTSPDGAWQITLVPERARTYRDVASVEDVLARREPLERERESWGSVTPALTAAPDQPRLYFPSESSEQPAPACSDGAASPSTVFVVYGRNLAARDAMFEFLRSLRLEPLDWDKLLAATGEASPYIGDVLAAGFPMAQAVVVLLTPDDEARVRPAFADSRDPPHELELTAQARPNVLFEAGMALAIHPKRTIIVELGELRPFSDVAGRHVVRMNDGVEARRSLIGRLSTAGCPVDMDGAWRETGGFADALLVAEAGGDFEPSGSPPHRARFALVEEPGGSGVRSGPITLRVENVGGSDQFEATVVGVRGSRRARPPWYVRWRNSAEQTKEILTGHSWLLDLCEDDRSGVTSEVGGDAVWRFFSPGEEIRVRPDGVDGATVGAPAAMRVTVRVTPRGDPECALENTVTLTFSEQGRVAVWDHYRLE
jgi:predicted nucleotide-binding protein